MTASTLSRAFSAKGQLGELDRRRRAWAYSPPRVQILLSFFTPNHHP